MKIFEHENIVYNVSSFSGKSHMCVGVYISPDSIRLINTNKPHQQAEFTLEEWKAFIFGVKNNEFDVNIK